MRNKAIGRYTLNKTEELEGISPEQYGKRKSKSDDVQDLNTCLFYNLVRQKKVTPTSAFAYLISNYELMLHIIDYLVL